MFYESSWFDRTEKNPKEKIVVLPAYHSWFMTATKGSLFIQDLNTLLI